MMAQIGQPQNSKMNGDRAELVATTQATKHGGLLPESFQL